MRGTGRVRAHRALAAIVAATVWATGGAALAAGVEPPPVTQEQLDAFRACLGELRGKSAVAGIAEARFDEDTSGLVPDPTVLDLLDAQPEFTTPIWDYLAALVDGQRVDDGRAMLREHATTLARAEAEHGVDAETIVAVWGVESDYGKTFGKRPLLQSLATLSCAGRRQAFFRGELFALLALLQAGDLRDSGITGSWAGAFGHTQFMPSTYRRVAVDFDGDGRRDLVGSVADALGSTANYLRRAGWRRGEPWGFEVRLPSGFDASLAGRRSKRALADWQARGLSRVDGTTLVPAGLAGDTKAGLLLPAGDAGPAFLVLRNFDAIYAYNAAESYALAIAHLSDRLRGSGAFATPWPTDDPGLDRMQRRELQALLLARGHDIGEVDGLVGTRTRRAIAAEQRRLGLSPVDGRAGGRILELLRAEPGTTPAATPAP
jgi:lytic murein transglycosylase